MRPSFLAGSLFYSRSGLSHRTKQPQSPARTIRVGHYPLDSCPTAKIVYRLALPAARSRVLETEITFEDPGTFALRGEDRLRSRHE